MRTWFLKSGVVTVAVVFSLHAAAQEAAPKAAKETRPLTLYQKLERANATGGPAPRRDFGGFWTGPLTPKLGPAPEMTPAGQAQFKQNKPDIFSASSNDPWATCDPLGVPRTMTTETRGVAFAQMQDHLVILTQYQKIWRAVWMDGRELPKNIGAKGGPQPNWYGYSVGHWDGDYTLVVNTAGVDDSTWLDRRGYPHSADMRVDALALAAPQTDAQSWRLQRGPHYLHRPSYAARSWPL